MCERVMTLQDRWCDLWRRLGAVGDADAHYARLSSQYAQPHRAYHTLEHIETLFAEFDAARQLSQRPEEVEYAIWFHDAIYDARSDDNEERSADLAAEVAAEIGLSAEFASSVQALIIATNHVDVPTAPDARLMVDCDLAPLGCSAEQFRENGMRVRRECDWMSEEQYIARRDAFLRQFLDRPHIYCTDLFREKYEAQARSNLQSVILSGQAGLRKA